MNFRKITPLCFLFFSLIFNACSVEKNLTKGTSAPLDGHKGNHSNCSICMAKHGSVAKRNSPVPEKNEELPTLIAETIRPLDAKQEVANFSKKPQSTERKHTPANGVFSETPSKRETSFKKHRKPPVAEQAKANEYPNQYNPLAIAAFATAIASILLSLIIPFASILFLPAIVLAIIAIVQITRVPKGPERQKGLGLAIAVLASVVLSVIAAIGLFILVFLLWI